MERKDLDPICKLISSETHQHYRICVAVHRSSHFKDKLKYPPLTTNPCFEREVSFKTVQGIKEAAGKPHYERMLLCSSEYAHGQVGGKRFSHLYISRAYRSNEVFVYLYDHTDKKIYLENFSTNIAIVDELNSFDFVEN